MLTPALAAVTGMLTIVGEVTQASQPDRQGSPSAPPQLYPLNCRGGAGLVFDTILPRSDTGSVVKLSLTFGANPTAGGAEGQGLQPSTCAWVDRPLNDAEPRRVWVTLHYSDSTPGRTVRDTGMYWSFLAYNGNGGHLVGEGYRHWHASSPPLPTAATPSASAPSRGSWLPFNPRHLHWYVLGWVLIAWLPMMTLTGLWSGWRRLAGLYPDRNAGQGRSFRCGSMVMGMTNYRGGARLTADESHLHFAMGMILRPGHPPFSVPWSDITVTRDAWPWFPLKGHPVFRLTLARHRTLRILVPVSAGERIVTESGGRLQVSEPRVPVAAAR